MSGQDMWDILLQKYHIQIEMAAGNYVAALSSVMDTEEGFDRLAAALIDIDRGISAAVNMHECEALKNDRERSRTIKAGRHSKHIVNAEIYHPNERCLEIFEAEDAYKAQCRYGAGDAYKTQCRYETEDAYKSQGSYEVRTENRWQVLQVPLEEAAGQVSASFINLYPPGIPLVVPGEIISPGLVRDLKSIIRLNLELQGLTENNFITILKG